jgi:cell division protein FtsL
MRNLLVLALVTVVSALGVVYTKYSSRMLFSQIQRLEQELESYEVELGQLRLAQNTWAERGRVEKLARAKLKMVAPQRDSILYIKP